MLHPFVYASILAHGGAPVSQDCGLAAPTGDEVYEINSYDCTERTDQGYSNGAGVDILVVTIDGEPVEKATANAYWVMHEAAAADGVDMHINSGFRTMEQQEYFYMCGPDGCCCCNDCNLAAAPGYSNHQSGHALDINTATPGVYNWLVAHGAEYGFSATVPSEDWHWEWWGGGPGGGICDIAAPPGGNLDASACEGVSGWAQDPDTPEQAIDVHVYFGGPAGDPAAVGVPINAGEQRDDLCEVLGTCNHGFTMAVPLSLQDGEPHPVHVYAIDSEGAANAELVASPQQLSCPRPELPDGFRRQVPDAAALAAWKFDPFWQMLTIDAAALEGFEEWNAIAARPTLVKTADDPEVWLVDSGWRRHVPDPEVAAAWGFDPATAEIVDAEILAQWTEGTPVRAQPRLVSSDGLTIWLVDDAQEAGDGGGNSASGGDDEGDDDGTGSAGDSATDEGGDSDGLPGQGDDAGDAG
ncbi:MAG: D-alanyl-D-alanine carboxypeptidase family protein, partial [Deltaproteobacteria bacterium]|nr:D-alanyl-D-alanine carboxypeptidase family protein [Nannocystaceae bacterium]